MNPTRVPSTSGEPEGNANVSLLGFHFPIEDEFPVKGKSESESEKSTNESIRFEHAVETGSGKNPRGRTGVDVLADVDAEALYVLAFQAVDGQMELFRDQSFFGVTFVGRYMK
jgi:hypothetical protein